MTLKMCDNATVRSGDSFTTNASFNDDDVSIDNATARGDPIAVSNVASSGNVTGAYKYATFYNYGAGFCLILTAWCLEVFNLFILLLLICL
ncbi:hypothetical protein STCU_10923 [Strigomonas culicis]|uniref:Uncharacterized protein n=1 Tax=Strigomonas culicis TaxID=28005 RepID=S9TJ40_9TRYP|nr:hypothetical protein STCU_10923 [Strigomonas culicis]|eukprot:EPY16889.1 hypothetical protein STCU_10923 [Strigomonas culicis]